MNTKKSVKNVSKGNEFRRKIIIKLHNECKTLREISEIVNRSRITIFKIIERYGIRKTLQNAKRTGRNSVLNDRDLRFIKKRIKLNPFDTATSICQELNLCFGKTVGVHTVRKSIRSMGYRNRVPRKKFFISEINRQKRIQFAKEYLSKDIHFWNDVVFSDESKFSISSHDSRAKVWRKINEELSIKNMIGTVKHGGGSILVWGCMAASGVGAMHVIEENTMDQDVYIRFLKENERPCFGI